MHLIGFQTHFNAWGRSEMDSACKIRLETMLRLLFLVILLSYSPWPKTLHEPWLSEDRSTVLLGEARAGDRTRA